MAAGFPGTDTKIALHFGELSLYQSLRFDLGSVDKRIPATSASGNAE